MAIMTQIRTLKIYQIEADKLGKKSTFLRVQKNIDLPWKIVSKICKMSPNDSKTVLNHSQYRNMNLQNDLRPKIYNLYDLSDHKVCR